MPAPWRAAQRPPGDKSISHRALILGALAQGRTEVEGLLEAEDIMATAQAARQFGATAERHGPAGLGPLPARRASNSPATPSIAAIRAPAARLLIGAASGYPISARFDGDQSLRKRPMNRVIAPLTQMGARFDGAPDRRCR